MLSGKDARLFGGANTTSKTSGSAAGRWMAQYYDKLAEIETSIRNLLTYIQTVKEMNHVERSELERNSMNALFTKNPKFTEQQRQLVNQLDFHLPRIEEYLQGRGGDDKGIIQLILDQKQAAQQYLKQLERNQTETTEYYRNLLVQYNGEMARKWNEIANLVPGVEHLESEAIHMEETMIHQLAENFTQFVASHKKVIEEDRDVVYEFVALRDIINFLAQFQEYHQQDFIDELHRISYKDATDLARNFFRGSTPKVLLSELQQFKDLPNDLNPQQLDQETRKQLQDFVKKIHKMLFKGSKFEEHLEQKEFSDDINEELSRFQQQLNALYNHLAKTYGNLSSEQFYALVLFSQPDMFSAFKRRKSAGNQLTLKQIWERANEKDKDAKKLVQQANNKIQEIVDGKGEQQFIVMQPTDSAIGKQRDAGKRDQIFDMYWKEFGANIQENFQGFGKQFEEAHLYLLRGDFQLEELYNLYLNMALRIQNLFDPDTEIKNMHNVSSIKQRFLQYFQEIRRGRQQDIDNLKSEIAKIKSVIQALEQSAQGKEQTINQLFERIEAMEKFIREEENRFAKETTEDNRGRVTEREHRVQPDKERLKQAQEQIEQYYRDIRNLREQLEQLRNSQTGSSYEEQNLAALKGELQSKSEQLNSLQEFIKAWDNEIAQQYNYVLLLIDRYGEFLSMIVNNKDHFKKQFIDAMPKTEGESDDYLWKALNRHFTYLGTRQDASQAGAGKSDSKIPPHLYDIR